MKDREPQHNVTHKATQKHKDAEKTTSHEEQRHLETPSLTPPLPPTFPTQHTPHTCVNLVKSSSCMREPVGEPTLGCDRMW